jgi:hypothetical protein
MAIDISKMGERLPVVEQYSPASIAASTVLTGAIDMKNLRRVLFIIQTGVLGASATVDFKITGSATSGGTYADVTGRSITQIVKATGDNKIAILEVTAEQVGAQGWRFIKGSLTIGTAASVVGVIALGDGLRYSDAGENDIAAVAEIK